ncbi:MAG: hypothetical protein R3F18_06740 [Lysobacterales bacterium]
MPTSASRRTRGLTAERSNSDLHHGRPDLALYIGIAFWARVGSTKDFYVAGGGVHDPIANGMATAADWMSAASFISMAGLISSWVMTVPSTCSAGPVAMWLLALLLAPYLRKSWQVHRA